MLANYGYIGLYLIVVTLLALSMIIIPLTLKILKVNPSHPSKAKNSIFECGMDTIGRAWVQFNFRYYFYALVFLALDVLVVFIYPWAAGLKKLGGGGLAGILVLLFIVLVGYVYAWRKKVLEWT